MTTATLVGKAMITMMIMMMICEGKKKENKTETHSDNNSDREERTERDGMDAEFKKRYNGGRQSRRLGRHQRRIKK
jgi:hypothetical protein